MAGTTAKEAPAPGTAAAPPRRRWKRRLAGTLVYLVLEALILPPGWQPTARVAVGMIRGYQAVRSPLLGKAGVECRFHPSCSEYAAGAIGKYGTLSGVARGSWRICRCAPWGPPPGTEDQP